MTTIIEKHLTDEEITVNTAAEKYFNLFVKDWAEKQRLDEKAQHQLVELLKDSFFFTESFLEEDEKKTDVTFNIDSILPSANLGVSKWLQ